MNITIKDLENGRDFWKWVLEDIDKNNYKSKWPEYERISKYDCACPLCEFPVDYLQCTGCPLDDRGLQCGETYTDNPWGIWCELSLSTETRTQAAQTILQVYEEEIAKMRRQGDEG